MDNFLIDVLLAMASPPAEGEQGGSMWFQCLFPLAFLGIFYALLIRPQQQQQKKHKKMVNELKSGARVVAGGVVGTIISVKKELKNILQKHSVFQIKTGFESADILSSLLKTPMRMKLF